MRYVDLSNIPVPASVLGFGGSALLGRSGRKESWSALTAAYDSGITFYDTARSYGYGQSESLLGEFFRGRRDRVIISTKFGILPVRQKWWVRAAKPVLRELVSVIPAARNLIRKQVQSQFQPGRFSAEILRSSLEKSLRELNTDYVDVLFAHSSTESILENDEVLAELEKAVISGKVRVAGISSTPSVVHEIMRRRPTFLKAFQFPLNLFDGWFGHLLPSTDNDGIILIANHPFGGISRVSESRDILRGIMAAESSPVTLRSKLQDVDDYVLAELVLNGILKVAGVDVVIPAMMKQKHLRSNVAAIQSSRFTATELSWIQARWPVSIM
jgi:aryl-alcohol dehydrogenase-like predicted oxidoreductase